jgi:hypothetical protein
VFKNTGVISGNKALGAEESVNVNQAVKELQKLQDNTKFGAPRLEQALGKEGAQAILKDMYAAQRSGIKAMTKQQWAVRAAKVLGATGVGYEVLRGLFGFQNPRVSSKSSVALGPSNKRKKKAATNTKKKRIIGGTS